MSTMTDDESTLHAIALFEACERDDDDGGIALLRGLDDDMAAIIGSLCALALFEACERDDDDGGIALLRGLDDDDMAAIIGSLCALLKGIPGAPGWLAHVREKILAGCGT